MNWKSAIATTCGAWLVFATCSTRTAYAALPASPCSLLTPAQVSAALGVTVGTGKESGSQVCEWSQPGNSLARKRASLHILGSVGKLTAVDQFNSIKMPVPVKGITKTPVSGLGDDAVYVTTGTLTGLTVKKGNSVFQIRINGFPAEQVKAKEETLAQDVLPKL